MFCRFCGKQIPDDSLFCQKCGRSLEITKNIPSPVPTVQEQDRPADPVSSAFEQAIADANVSYREMTGKNTRAYVSASGSRYYTNGSYTTEDLTPRDANTHKNKSLPLVIASVCSAVFALILFLMLFPNMAPGFGETKIISYITGAASACVLFTVLIVISFKRRSKTTCIISIVLSALVVCFFAVTHLIFFVKYDAAYDSVPSDEFVNVKLEIFPDSDYEVEDVTVEISGYEIKDGEVFSALAPGHYTASVTLRDKYGQILKTQESFNLDPYELKYGQIELFFIEQGLNHADFVNVRFTRVLSFWEVVTH